MNLSLFTTMPEILLKLGFMENVSYTLNHIQQGKDKVEYLQFEEI